jgi:DNA-binding response OmpR family regulator
MDNSSLLLVEDDSLVALVAEDALTAGGFGVVLAMSGSEALNRLDDKNADFAALITDIDLGSAPDGWAVARHARTLKGHISIVYTTAHGAADWPVRGVPNSVLVQKPYAPAQLLTAVSTLITEADTRRSAS